MVEEKKVLFCPKCGSLRISWKPAGRFGKRYKCGDCGNQELIMDKESIRQTLK